MKKWLLFLAVAIAVSVWTYVREQSGPGMMASAIPNRRITAASASLPQRRTSFSPIVVAGETPLEVTKKYLDEHRTDLKLQEHHDLAAEEYRTPLGTSVRYSVTQDGIPVLGLSISFRLDRDLRIVEIENEYRPLEKADLNEPVAPLGQITAEAEKKYGLLTDNSLEAGKVLYAHPASTMPRLALAVPMKETTPRGRGVLMLLRASDGQLLKKTFSRSF